MEWPKITKDTPISEIQRIHKMIWDYVIEHGEKPDTPYRYDFVCCEYEDLREGYCKDCPMKSWACSVLHNMLVDTVFYNDFEESKEITTRIHDTPFKEANEDD